MVDNVAVVDRGTGGRENPASRTVNSNIYSIDITDKFLTAAYQLPAGALIKDEQFTLFESVGALEIGDPKMDSGCGDDEDDLDMEFDVSRELSPAETLWLMDELLCREAAWQAGYPLSQTLFTSYHIDSLLWPDPIDLSEAHFGRNQVDAAVNPLSRLFFRAYCLGVIKCCDMVLQMVTSQHYYEEEDFATQLFNRELLRRFAPAAVIEIMQQALDWLSTATIERNHKEDLASWMNFRIKMLEAYAQHGSNHQSDGHVNLAHLEALSKQNSTRTNVSHAFSSKLQRRFASNVPPRPTISMTALEAFAFWSQSIQDYSNVFNVKVANNNTDLETALLAFATREPQPCVYVRSLIQSFLTQDNLVNGRRSTLDCIWEDLRTLSLASSPLLPLCVSDDQTHGDKSDLALRYIDSFLVKIEGSFINILRTLCLNRSRLRRSLCHAAMEWDEVQAEAEELDDELRVLIGERPYSQDPGSKPSFSYPLGSWTYHMKLKQVFLITQLGFDLSIYAPYEIPSMYWYLAYVCETHLIHLERISFFVAAQERQLSPFPDTIHPGPKLRQHCQSTTKLLYRHYGRLKATEAFARCLHGLTAVLRRHGHLQQPASTYSSDEWRHELRMRPFQHLSIPELPTYGEIEVRNQMDGRTDEDVLSQASVQAQAAKKSWEAVLREGWHVSPLMEESVGESTAVEHLWSANIRATIRAAIAANLVIGKLQTIIKTSPGSNALRSLQVTLPSKGDGDYWHSSWLVPRILT